MKWRPFDIYIKSKDWLLSVKVSLKVVRFWNVVFYVFYWNSYIAMPTHKSNCGSHLNEIFLTTAFSLSLSMGDIILVSWYLSISPSSENNFSFCHYPYTTTNTCAPGGADFCISCHGRRHDPRLVNENTSLLWPKWLVQLWSHYLSWGN